MYLNSGETTALILDFYACNPLAPIAILGKIFVIGFICYGQWGYKKPS